MANPVTIGMMGASTAIGMKQAHEQGKAESADAIRQGTEKLAAGTRKSGEAARKGAKVESDARAAMAGGGGGFDAGSAEIIGGIGAKTEYNVLSALYEGEEGYAQGQHAARMAKYRAKQKMLSTALSGGSQMMSSYQAPSSPAITSNT